MDERLHGVLHGMQWIMSYYLSDFEISPPQRGGFNTSWETTTLRISPPLIYYNILFERTYMSRMVMKEHSVENSVVHVFSYTKACDHTKINFNFPWYGLLMSFKGPHMISWSWPLATV